MLRFRPVWLLLVSENPVPQQQLVITMKTMITTVMVLCSVISQSSGLFKCPDDGHWPDPESCASYYHCANGRPYAGTCPAGLLWNGVKSECDFPENVNCDVSIGEAAKFKVRRKV